MDGRLAALGLVLSLAAGCYCSHQREPRDDAGARVDAGRQDAASPPDAWRDDGVPPDATVWIPVDVADYEVSYERCETREGQTLVLRVRLITDGCDEPGNVRWDVHATTREIFLRPFVWRPTGRPPCPPFAREIVRDVALRGAGITAGAWSVIVPDGTSVPVLVGPPPPELTCTDCRAEGETCAVDEECEGLRECVPVRGDAACAAFCASSCQPFAEEEPGAEDLACSQRLGRAACREDPNLGWNCALIGGLCEGCPEGLRCGAGTCDWTASPWPEPCRSDAECPGRSCVLLPGSTEPSCQIRCRGDHPCPFGETCGPASLVCPLPKI